MDASKAVKIRRNVYWVGAIDWGIRDFHGYAIPRGTTYNAYLIVDDKIVLLDTVKAPFYDEMTARIASVIDPQKIDVIISNHSELDHSGCLPPAIRDFHPEEIIASRMGAKALQDHQLVNGDITIAEDGVTLNLGKKTLTFFETRMLHWPDSMFTYLKEDEILFSQDAFGMHLATGERFDDELEFDVLKREAAKYYANILLPYSPLVTKLLKRLQGAGIPLEMIAPDHGPVWRAYQDDILDLYSRWAEQKRTGKAVVVYDTMWQSTAKMAAAIADGLISGGAAAVVMPLSGSTRSDVAAELLDAGAFIVGSPTLNNHLFPTVADVLTYIQGLKPRGLVGAAFGSYGWGGEAVKQIAEMLASMGVELAADSVKVKYVPEAGALQKCYDLGLNIAAVLRRRSARSQT